MVLGSPFLYQVLIMFQMDFLSCFLRQTRPPILGEPTFRNCSPDFDTDVRNVSRRGVPWVCHFFLGGNRYSLGFVKRDFLAILGGPIPMKKLLQRTQAAENQVLPVGAGLYTVYYHPEEGPHSPLTSWELYQGSVCMGRGGGGGRGGGEKGVRD